MQQERDDRRDIVIRIPVFRIPWDSNTFRGFILALFIICFFVGLSPFVNVPSPTLAPSDTTAIPLTVLTQLRFGEGDNAGKSHGNLSREGASAKSDVKAPRFTDASSPKQGEVKSTAKPGSTSDLSVNVKPTVRQPEEQKNVGTGKATENVTTSKNQAIDNSASMSSGDKSAADDGTGRGWRGSGSGAGLGYNIEWGGGGGNVVVLNKSVPKAPAGLNNSTIVKLKFVVGKNGDVESVIPLTRGAPQAESAALKAMWLWKFRVKNEERAEGIIKFTFDVN